MTNNPKPQTLTELLRALLREAPSQRSSARNAGVGKASLIRFLRRDQSMRLDLADRLAAYFGVEFRLAEPRVPAAEGRRRAAAVRAMQEREARAHPRTMTTAQRRAWAEANRTARRRATKR